MINWIRKILKSEQDEHIENSAYMSDEDSETEERELILLQDDICAKHHG